MKLSFRKANALGTGLFVIGLGIMLYYNAWWPYILLAIWVSLACRQFFTGRIADLIITSCILLGLFLVNFVQLSWSVIMPILLIIGGAYIVFKEFYMEEDKE